MGVLAIGMSFSAPIAVVGVLLHVLAHAAAKGTAFFGAGSVVRKFGTKDMSRIRGGIGALPWSGPMLVLAVLGLSALPPFGIFRSEFLIVSGRSQRPARRRRRRTGRRGHPRHARAVLVRRPDDDVARHPKGRSGVRRASGSSPPWSSGWPP